MKPTGRVRPNARALRQLLKPRVDPRAKPAKKRGPLARRIWKIRRRLSSLPPRLWYFAGALVLAAVMGWWLFAPAPAPKTATGPAGPASRAAGTGQSAVTGTADSAPSGAGIPEKQLAFIKSVRLKPDQPSRSDSIKAEVTAAPGAPGKLAYTYLWRVNDRIIEEAKGETLNLSAFKIGDRVNVTVTPSDGDSEGFAVVSPEVAVHSSPPSLTLELKRPVGKVGDPIDMQLVSVAPDSGQVVFSLELPHVPGLTIDKSSGKISWRRQPDQQGTIRFGAGVQDNHGTKVTKTFEITVNQNP